MEKEKEKEREKRVSSRSFIITLLLLVFFGYLGGHRFYAGRYLTGLLWFFTGGLFTLGYIIDLIYLLTFNFKDDHDKIIMKC